MRVQRTQRPITTSEAISTKSQESWIVLGNDYRPVAPICKYLSFLENLERSPNTIHTYANHLKLYWEFLHTSQFDWKEISIETLSSFIAWLRQPEPNSLSVQSPEPKRSERTINNILSAISGFYEFHEQLGVLKGPNLYRDQFFLNRSYKPLLHHISKGKTTKTRLLKLKQSRKIPQVLTPTQVKELIDACANLRDKFLLSLLYETGIRIGQALGLRHSDVHSWDNEILIIPRNDNANGARAKSKDLYTVHVSKELMGVYSKYLIEEYPAELDSDYVFVNIWGGKVGSPLTYSNAINIFDRLCKKTEIQAHPHLFRHTHATDLLREGWDMAHIQKRLGHRNIQTTINTYCHISNDDMKVAFQKYVGGEKD